MMRKFYIILFIVCSLFSEIQLMAQINLSGQIRARAEFRDGQGTPSVDTIPAFFISQRTRLNAGYTGYRFKIYISIQDVRVWGQDASSTNRITAGANDGLMVHEAWGEVSLVDTGKVIKNFTLKIGRQELVYDDVRLLGNLDWLQQARRHDALLLKFEHMGWTLHLGTAYNQNAERKSNTIYNGVPSGYPAGTNGIGTMYKSMQFLYTAKKLKFGNASWLFFKDDFSKFHFASTDVQQIEPIYERSVWSRLTTGINVFGTAFKKIGFAVSAFYQGGKYREGTALNEYLLSGSFSYPVAKKISLGFGADITSGNNGSDPEKRYQRFDPLYGTPHKFWGYMDYFYVADGFGSNGLIDTYAKAKFKPKDNLIFSLDVHQFSLPNAVSEISGEELSKSLGQEVDFVFNLNLTKETSIEAGYSAMFATETMTSVKVKNVNKTSSTSHWAYLMISIKPEWLVKK